MYARRSFRIEGERHHNPGAIHLWLSFSSRSLIHFSFDASRPPTRCHSPSIDGCIPADPLIRNSSSEAAESSPFPAIQPLPPSYDIVADYSSLSLRSIIRAFPSHCFRAGVDGDDSFVQMGGRLNPFLSRLLRCFFAAGRSCQTTNLIDVAGHVHSSSTDLLVECPLPSQRWMLLNSIRVQSSATPKTAVCSHHNKKPNNSRRVPFKKK